jgi:hypothetical protein
MEIILQFVILFALISVGYGAKKTKIISNAMNQDVGNILVYISLPSLIFASLAGFTFSPRILQESSTLLMIAFFLYLLMIAVSYLLPRWSAAPGKKRDLFQFALVFGNTGFLGFPIAFIVFGEKGVFFMAVCDIFFSILVWTFGVMVLCRHARQDEPVDFLHSAKHALRQLKNPNIIAVVLGLAVFSLQIPLPETSLRFFEILGSLTTPLSMIFIGSMLADISLRGILGDFSIIVISLERLLIVPAIVGVILFFAGFSEMLLAIPILYCAMPVAASTPILALKYGNDEHLSARLVFISTLLSMLTLPLIIFLIRLVFPV